MLANIRNRTRLLTRSGPPANASGRRIGLWTATIIALITGVLPRQWLGNNHDARIVWGAELAFFALGALVLRRRRTGCRAKRRGLLFVAVALWLLRRRRNDRSAHVRLPLIQIGTAVLRSARTALASRQHLPGRSRLATTR